MNFLVPSFLAFSTCFKFLTSKIITALLIADILITLCYTTKWSTCHSSCQVFSCRICCMSYSPLYSLPFSCAYKNVQSYFLRNEIFFVIFWDKGKKLCYFSTIDYHELWTFTVNSFFLSKDLKDQLIKFSLQSILISLQIDIN